MNTPFVPDHQLVKLIDSGAYGEVWLARNAVGTPRAIKVVRLDQHASANSFEREFKGLQKFEPVSRTHEGLVDILTLGLLDDGAGFYYVMELADNAESPDADDRGPITEPSATGCGLAGSNPSFRTSGSYSPRTLRAELRRRGSSTAEEVVALGLKLSAALAHLHAQGLVHRDVKPSNILFIAEEPKLADAGLVAAVDDAQSLVGTAGYIAPEGPGTPQADVYALGKVLYEAAFAKDRQEFPALPGDITSRPDHTRLLELNAVLLKACAPDSRARYQSADQLRKDLELLQAGRSVKRRHVWRQWVSGAKPRALRVIGFAVVLAVGVGLWRQFRPSDLSGEGPRSPIDGANALCDQAMRIIRGDTYASFPEAYTKLHKAIDLDPKFARPYAGLFELAVREWSPTAHQIGPEEYQRIIAKLDQLGPKLAATYCAQSIVSYGKLDFPRAEKLILKAVKAAPKYELAHTSYGFMLLTWGWPAKAREQLDLSKELTASKVTIYVFLGHTYRLERDYAKAIACYTNALAIEPQHQFAYGALGHTYEGMGDYPNAIINFAEEALESAEDKAATKQAYQDLLRAFQEGGPRAYYQQRWKGTEKNPDSDFYWKACIQIRLGNINQALNYLDKAFQARKLDERSESTLKYLLLDEHWDGVRDDPRFKELLDKMTFTEVMAPRK